MSAVLTEYTCNSFEDFISNCKAFFSANGYSMGSNEGNSFAKAYQISERFLVSKGDINFYFSCFESGTSGRIDYKVYFRNSPSTVITSFSVNRNYIGICPPDLVQSGLAFGASEPSLCVSNIGLSGFPLSLRIFKFDTDALLFCIECWPGVYRFLYAGYIYKNTITGTISYPYFSGSLSLSNANIYSDYPFCVVNDFSLSSYGKLNYGMFSFFGQGMDKLRSANSTFSSFNTTGEDPQTNYVKINNNWFAITPISGLTKDNSDYFYGSSPLSKVEMLFSVSDFKNMYNNGVLGIISDTFALSSLSNFPILFDSVFFQSGPETNSPLGVFGYIPDIYVAQSNGNTSIYDVTLGNVNYKIIPIIQSTINKKILGSFAVKMG